MLSQTILDIAERIQNDIKENEFINLCNVAKDVNTLQSSYDNLEDTVDTLRKSCEIQKNMTLAVEHLLVVQSRRTITRFHWSMGLCCFFSFTFYSLILFVFYRSTQSQ